MIEKNETEIMKNWASTEPPLLSVAAIAYNHEDYISEALDSMLMQKTDFPFEIIVHDDCSTDNTVNILKIYVEKYPNIIKLILQKENQYSQGKKIERFFDGKMKGQYIALCECDDYWIDPGKLQTQIDLMKENPDCDMSFHAAEERFNKDKHGNITGKHVNGNKIFSTSEVISGYGVFCPTASLVYRKDSLSTLPSFFDDAPVGDYFLQIFGSLNGGLLYIDKVMSVYRQGIPGSWSSLTQNVSKREKITQSMIETLDKLDIYLNSKYHNEIKEIKSYYYYAMSLYYLRNDMFVDFKKNIVLSYNTSQIKFIRFFIYSLRSFPRLIKLLLGIRDIFR